MLHNSSYVTMSRFSYRSGQPRITSLPTNAQQTISYLTPFEGTVGAPHPLQMWCNSRYMRTGGTSNSGQKWDRRATCAAPCPPVGEAGRSRVSLNCSVSWTPAIRGDKMYWRVALETRPLAQARVRRQSGRGMEGRTECLQGCQKS